MNLAVATSLGLESARRALSPSLSGSLVGTGSLRAGRSLPESESSLTARNRRPFCDLMRDRAMVNRMTRLDVGAAMGKIGLPAPLRELVARDWDAIVVGAGHNGLTAAAYLARAGRSVLVLERREQIGGACTLEQPFPGPALPDQSLRVCRRAARRPGGPRARARAARLPGLRGRPQPLVPAARRQLGGALPRSGAHGLPTYATTGSRSGTSEASMPTTSCSSDCAGCFAPDPGIPGWAPLQPATSWRSFSATTTNWSRWCSRSRSRTPSTATSTTSASSMRSSARE